jgi:hypothetical protein
MAGLLLLAGLSLPTVVPNLSDSLADFYLGGSLRLGVFHVPWGAMLLGGLSGAVTHAMGIALNWRRTGSAAT